MVPPTPASSRRKMPQNRAEAVMAPPTTGRRMVTRRLKAVENFHLDSPVDIFSTQRKVRTKSILRQPVDHNFSLPLETPILKRSVPQENLSKNILLDPNVSATSFVVPNIPTFCISPKFSEERIKSKDNFSKNLAISNFSNIMESVKRELFLLTSALGNFTTISLDMPVNTYLDNIYCHSKSVLQKDILDQTSILAKNLWECVLKDGPSGAANNLSTSDLFAAQNLASQSGKVYSSYYILNLSLVICELNDWNEFTKALQIDFLAKLQVELALFSDADKSTLLSSLFFDDFDIPHLVYDGIGKVYCFYFFTCNIAIFCRTFLYYKWIPMRRYINCLPLIPIIYVDCSTSCIIGSKYRLYPSAFNP
jgi:hypothetical protein